MRFLIFHFLASICALVHAAPYEVVINVPVADLCADCTSLQNLPIDTKIMGNCIRIHQGLFNERATCLTEDKNRACICFGHIVYDASKNILIPKRSPSFWVEKRCLTALTDQLKSYLPPATYDLTGKTIVLKFPWKGYSLATRFRRAADHDTEDAYAILCPDYQTKNISIEYVPHTHALIEAKKSPQEQRALFVELVSMLFTQIEETFGTTAVVPYVWGGSSFTEPYTPTFYLEGDHWTRPGKNNPYSGYDCSEFIMRMAQVAGIDFPWKTSATMEHHLAALKPGEPLEDGDILWIPGHVAIIYKTETNELAEARGYGSGFGRVRHTRVSDYFLNIKDYEELRAAYHAGTPVTLLTSDGTPMARSFVCKILKLMPAENIKA